LARVVLLASGSAWHRDTRRSKACAYAGDERPEKDFAAGRSAAAPEALAFCLAEEVSDVLADDEAVELAGHWDWSYGVVV
jgi:hypothetical protein